MEKYKLSEPVIHGVYDGENIKLKSNTQIHHLTLKNLTTLKTLTTLITNTLQG